MKNLIISFGKNPITCFKKKLPSIAIMANKATIPYLFYVPWKAMVMGH
jgi:hypothetical protein